MARMTEQESKALKDASRLAEGVGYALAAKWGYGNFRECEDAQ